MSIHRRPTKRRGAVYDVRLRTPDGRVATRTFATKTEARLYEAEERSRIARGTWVDPRAASTSFSDWAAEWLRSDPSKRPKTLASDEMVIRRHLEPAFGARPIGAFTPRDVQALVNNLARRYAPSTVRRYYAVLRAILNAAVLADLIGRSPCRGIKLPKAHGDAREPLKADQVQALADAVPARYRALILLAAESGMRFGELAALRVGRLDLLRRVVAVFESAVEVHGELVYGEPKSAAGRRVIAMSHQLADVLAAHLSDLGRTGADPDALVFAGPAGGPLRYSTFRSRVWLPARTAAGVEWAGFHDLRRASATALVDSGVDVRTAQHRLGHSDPRLTLGLYAQVVRSSDRDAAETLGAHFARDERAMERDDGAYGTADPAPLLSPGGELNS